MIGTVKNGAVVNPEPESPTLAIFTNLEVRCDQCGKRHLDLVRCAGQLTIRFRCIRCGSIQNKTYDTVVPPRGASPLSQASVGSRTLSEPMIISLPDERGGSRHGAGTAQGTHREDR